MLDKNVSDEKFKRIPEFDKYLNFSPVSGSWEPNFQSNEANDLCIHYETLLEAGWDYDATDEIEDCKKEFKQLTNIDLIEFLDYIDTLDEKDRPSNADLAEVLARLIESGDVSKDEVNIKLNSLREEVSQKTKAATVTEK